MEEINKVDEMLKNLVEMTYNESEKAKTRGIFTKDLIESCGIVISLAYGRWG